MFPTYDLLSIFSSVITNGNVLMMFIWANDAKNYQCVIHGEVRKCRLLETITEMLRWILRYGREGCYTHTFLGPQILKMIMYPQTGSFTTSTHRYYIYCHIIYFLCMCTGDTEKTTGCPKKNASMFKRP